MKLTSLKKEKTLRKKCIYTFDYESDDKMIYEKLVCMNKLNQNTMKNTTFTFFSTENFINYLFDNDITNVYAYNLKFDSRFFINYILSHPECEMNLIRGGSTILSLFLHKENKIIRFRDFYPFCLNSLDNVAKAFKLKTQKYPNIPSEDKESWNKFFKNCSMDELEHHCKNDVIMLSELIHVYQRNFFNIWNINVCDNKIYSLAGLSMKVYRIHFIDKNNEIENPFVFKQKKQRYFPIFTNNTDLKIKDYKCRNYKVIKITYIKDKNKNLFISPYRDYVEVKRLNWETNIDELQYRFVRKSYHGGYTGNMDNIIHNNCISFDINSSYPFQASLIKFPSGRGYFTENEDLFISKTKEIPAFCELSIDFSTINIKFPVYTEEEEFKTVNTIWNGVLTSYEYEYLKKKNVHMKFIRGIYYTDFDKSYSLKRYCERIYSLKRNAETEVSRYINKILLNSLTGKFGQRIDLENRRNESIVTKNQYEDKMNNKILNDNYRFEPNSFETEKYGKKFTKNTSIAEKLEISNDKDEALYYSYEKEDSKSIKNFTLPSWISLITAKGRIQLLEMIEKTNAFYWDSDSVYCHLNQFDNIKVYKTVKLNNKVIELRQYSKNGEIIIQEGLELGDWKMEHKFEYIRIFAPKLYCGLLQKDKKHNEFVKQIFVKSKGIKISDKNMKLEMFDKIMKSNDIIKVKQIRPLSLRQIMRVKNVTYKSENGMVKTLESNPENNIKIKF